MITRTLVAVILLANALLVPCIANEDPAIRPRKQFVAKYQKALERKGWNATTYVAGKKKDVLDVHLPNASVEATFRFEKQCIEPIKSEAAAVGFTKITIETGVYSANFPKGVWEISLP